MRGAGLASSTTVLIRGVFGWATVLSLVLAVGCEAPLIAEDDDTSDSEATAPKGLPGGASGGPFDTCLQRLEGAEVRKVGASLERTFRLSKDNATDIARDAMLKVCVRHADQPYDRLEAALQQAATNQARRGWSRSKRFVDCPLDDTVPACRVSDPPDARFASELRAAAAALCQESALDDGIIQRRVIDEVDFPTIGAELGLTADQARTRYFNAMRRVKVRAERGLCDPPRWRRSRVEVREPPW